MKKVLMIASVASMIDQFNKPNIKLLIDMDYQVDVACNFESGNTCTHDKIEELLENLDKINVDCYQIDFSRDILNVKNNIKAYRQLNKVIKGDAETIKTRHHKKSPYTFVHCHSPIGGVLGRLAGKWNHIKTIYTAHGFHFFKGAPLKNWLIFFPIEYIFGFLTDVLLTISKEDYDFSYKHIHAKKVSYIPGIGIDSTYFSDINLDIRRKKRYEFGISEDDILILSVGELNENKNHQIVLKALGKLNKENIKYMICGKGEKEKELCVLAKKNGIEQNFILPGFQNDMKEIYAAADIFVLPSKREGLSVALMEAMASGLPVICTKIRGNVDLIKDKMGGYLVEIDDGCGMKRAVETLADSEKLRKRYGRYNASVIREFDIENVMEITRDIYQKIER